MIKRIFLILLFPLVGNLLYGQQKNEAEKWVDEGVALEDSGKSLQAMENYQRALDIDKDNLAALTEMSYSLMSLNKYEESIKYCKRALKTHKNDAGLKTVYLSYGNALDALKQSDRAIGIYDEGLSIFPEYFQLYFNKGIALAGINKITEAISCFQRSVELNPEHAGSNLALGNILLTQNNRIPALMAYGRFLIIEPETKRSVNGLENLQNIMKANVSAKPDKSISIQIDPGMLDVKNEKQKTNNFSSVELTLSLSSALDYDSAVKNLTTVDNFIRKMDLVCESLKNSEKENFGFYWDFYAPWYIDMKDKNQIQSFAYIAFASSEDKDVVAWLTSHKSEVDAFYKWSDSFKWRIN